MTKRSDTLSMTSNYPLSLRASQAVGQPISDLMSRALANPKLISLAAGFVDQHTLPVEPTRAALEAIWADPVESRAALQYGTTPGFLPLREAISHYYAEADGSDVLPPSPEQIVVTAGSNQLLHLVAESILDPGDIVLCASPSYFVFLGTVSNLGARSFGVAVDDEGMIPQALEAALEEIEAAGELPRVKAIYLVTYFDNPRGVSTSLERRAEIVRIAQRWSRENRIYVIDDAAYRELRYEGPDEPSTRAVDPTGETVVVAGTFSKSFSPGIRVGWGVLPPQLVAPVCNQKGNIDFGSPNFGQHLMAAVLRENLYTPHVESLRVSYRRKRDAMLAAAAEHLGPLAGVRWTVPAGGLYVWLELPPSIDAGPQGRLFDVAIRHGVLYVPGGYCYPLRGEAVGVNTIRLSFGVQTEERIAAGVALLAEAIVEVVGSS